MNNIIEWLRGKKVYLVSIFFAVFNCLLVFGVLILTPEQITAIDGIFMALFGASFRATIK